MAKAPPQRPAPPPVASTGIAGLDAILHGGLPREEMHLVQGVAGTGKTGRIHVGEAVLAQFGNVMVPRVDSGGERMRGDLPG